MKYNAITIGLAFFWSWAADSFAQPEAETPRQKVVSTFDRLAPKVGEPLGEIELLDAEGGKVEPTIFRGRHTVLVFGCLT